MKKEYIGEYKKRVNKRLETEEKIIESLSKIRKEAGLSQQDVCNLIDLLQPSLARIEKGKHSPQLDTLIKILDAYGYTIEITKK